MGSNPEHPFLLASVPLNYMIFTILYTLCIVHAVLFGVTFGFIPEVSHSMEISLALLTSLGIRLFIVLLPLFLVASINTVQFKRILSKQSAPQPGAVRILLGVLTSCPLVLITVYVYHYLPSFIIGWPLIVVVQSIVAASFLMAHFFIIAACITENTKAYLVRSLRNPELWTIALVLGALLLFPILALINPIQKGYFHFFTSFDQLLYALPDLFWRALLLGALMPLMTLSLQYIDRISFDQSSS